MTVTLNWEFPRDVKKKLWFVAVHEAAHAIASFECGLLDDGYVTIEPCEGAAGHVRNQAGQLPTFENHENAHETERHQWLYQIRRNTDRVMMAMVYLAGPLATSTFLDCRNSDLGWEWEKEGQEDVTNARAVLAPLVFSRDGWLRRCHGSLFRRVTFLSRDPFRRLKLHVPICRIAYQMRESDFSLESEVVRLTRGFLLRHQHRIHAVALALIERRTLDHSDVFQLIFPIEVEDKQTPAEIHRICEVLKLRVFGS